MLLSVALGVACGEGESGAVTEATGEGRWAAAFPHGSGVFELTEKATGEVLGTLSIETEIWSLAGTRDGAALSFALLPSRGEDLLFTTLGLVRPPTDGAAPHLRLQHASDRLVFDARLSDDAEWAKGTVSPVLGEGVAEFRMEREP